MPKKKEDYRFEYEYVADLETHYTAEYFFIGCFDDRLHPLNESYRRDKGIEHADCPLYSGAAKVLASPEKEGDRDFVVREIRKAMKLHGITKVMIRNHSHCGAYGGIEPFGGDEEKEFQYHVEELKKAKDFLLSEIPNLEAVELRFYDGKKIIVIE